jgi:hypothetical protein
VAAKGKGEGRPSVGKGGLVAKKRERGGATTRVLWEKETTPQMSSDFASNGPQPFPSSTHRRSTFGQYFLGYYINKSTGLVEVSSDVVLDETNGSPREQVDLDDIDEDDVLTAAMRTMAIGDVRPQEQQEQDQPSSSTMVHPPTCSIPKIQILKFSQTRSKFKMNFKFHFKMFVCELLSTNKV